MGALSAISRRMGTRALNLGTSLALRAGFREQRRIIGPGSLLCLPQALSRMGVTSVLIVTSSGMVRRGTIEPLQRALKVSGIAASVYSDVKPDPTVACVEKGLASYQEGCCNGIVALGGGSAIDCAKAIGMRVANPGLTIPQMRGVMRVRGMLPPLVAVPTTAGTGSEVTAAAVITDVVDGRDCKYPISDSRLVPRLAVLDAQLTLGLPPEVTAYSGMDALSHAVEAYVNRFCPPVASEAALEAVGLVFSNLPRVMDDPSDLEARECMLTASYGGGLALTNAFVGYVHALAHGIGALYDIPHGRAIASVMPVVLEAYGSAAHARLAQLSHAAGVGDPNLPDDQNAARLIEGIRSLNERLGIPAHIERLDPTDFDLLADRALEEATPWYPVPVIWGHEQMVEVLERLLPGA